RRATPGVRWIALLIVVAARTPAHAETIDELPVGVAVGPVIIAPSLTCSYDYDSNVFLFDPTEVSSPGPPGSATAEPAAAPVFPFGRSVFRLSDTYRWKNYEKTSELDGRAWNEAAASLLLRFSTRDAIEVSAELTDGRANTETFDPGGQVVFRGQ